LNPLRSQRCSCFDLYIQQVIKSRAEVKDARTVDGWIKGNAPYRDAEERLRLAFQVVRTLSDHDSPRIVQAWLAAVNPELGDRILLCEGDLSVGPEVVAAARAFIARGLPSMLESKRPPRHAPRRITLLASRGRAPAPHYTSF
jgi:hypothetical protein